MTNSHEARSTHYQILGVPPGATLEVLHERYRMLARSHHPDAGGDAETFAAIAEAAGVLLDPAKRRQYDAKLRMERPLCSDCRGSGQTWKYVGFKSRFPALCRRCAGVGYE